MEKHINLRPFFLPTPPSIRCGGSLLTFDRPKIMGILNITPDSFSDGGRLSTEEALILQAERLVSEGADILDIGAQSTRPGATLVSAAEEITRLGSSIQLIKKLMPHVLISIDTFWADVAEYALGEGVDIINDVSGGFFDPKIIDIAEKYRVPYVLSHSNSTHETMHDKRSFTHVAAEINSWLLKRAEHLRQRGIDDIILDPGFGFGKTIADQHQLVQNIGSIGLGIFPVLVGISRKSFLYLAAGKGPHEINSEMENAHRHLLQSGVHILRVHDAAPVRRLIDELFPIEKSDI